MYRIIDFAHKVLNEHLKETDNAIDATCGNGFDTLFLARCVPKGWVYAFDIQPLAIKNTKILLEKANAKNVTCILDSHERLFDHIKDPVHAVIFNLGYLPKGDKSITTKYESTLDTLDSLLEYALNNKHFLIVIVIYTGHTEGRKESEMIATKLKNLGNKHFLVTRFENFNRNHSPYVLTIQSI